MSGDDKEPSMVFQPWRFEPPGKNSETEKGRKISNLLTAAVILMVTNGE